MNNSSMNIRAQAARVIANILKQQGSLSSHLPAILKQLDGHDRAFLQQLCYDCCRYLPALQVQAQQFISKPLKRKDSDIQALILLGLYQLSHSRTPQHAIIAETVEAAVTLKKPWAKGLINGILRNAQREEQLLDSLQHDPVYRYAHPRWLIQRLKQAWPEDWQQILQQNNLQGPMTLRVARQSQTSAVDSRRHYAEKLDAAGIPYQLCPFADSAMTLEHPLAVDQLPGFMQGEVSVQDEAAQLAAGLLDLQPGQHVLDACAAPGGKTCHILETESGLSSLLALDVSEERLQRITENLERLNLSCQLCCADAGSSDWWDGRAFDRILLDAPCSATGVIRRNPDIKSLRQSADITDLCQLQQQILQNLWPMLAPGGKLLYATCSVLPEENEHQVSCFLSAHEDASEIPLEADWGMERSVGRQLFPQPQGHDGFYYALLQKR